MRNDAWQSLASLESRDVVSDWFHKIHRRTISAERAKEITAAAKQGREYFANAERSEYSVKALLNYYGVTSLARSLTLLMMRDTGEAALAKGHGLETVNWSSVLGGSLSQAISKIGNLEVKTCKGLFADFIFNTKNRTDLHFFTSAVDFSIEHPVPDFGKKILLSDVLSRVPDLSSVRKRSQTEACHAGADYHGKDSAGNAQFQLWSDKSGAICKSYSELGYEIAEPRTILVNDAILQAQPFLAYNSYIENASLAIPGLHIVKPYPDDLWLSQLSSIHLVSYFLGMLCRYYPTQWMSLISGEKGDRIWPELYAAHKIINAVYPELVIKYIDVTLQAREELVT